MPQESQQVGSTSDNNVWSSHILFVLSMINVLTNSNVVIAVSCYLPTNGGCALLIPFFVSLALFSIPVMYIEMLIGRIFQKSFLSFWTDVCPWLKGAGYSALIVNFFRAVCLSYELAFEIATVFNFTVASDIWENSTMMLPTTESYSTEELTPSLEREYYPVMTGPIVITMLSLYICVRGGARNIGRLSVAAFLLIRASIFVLLIKSVSLKYSEVGFNAVFNSDWARILRVETWISAIVYSLVSSAAGSGIVISHASYLGKQNLNTHLSAIVIIVDHALMSFLCLIIFSCFMGYLHGVKGIPFRTLTDNHLKLAFYYIPLALSEVTYPRISTAVYIVLVISTTLVTLCGLVEVINSALITQRFWIILTRGKGLLVLIGLLSITTLPIAISGGNSFYLQYRSLASVSTYLPIVALECLIMTTYHGYYRFAEQVYDIDLDCIGVELKILWQLVIPMIAAACYIGNNAFLRRAGNGSHSMLWREPFTGFILLAIVPTYAAFWFIKLSFFRWYVSRSRGSVNHVE